MMCLQLNTGNSYWPIFLGNFSLCFFLNILNYLSFKNYYLLLTTLFICFMTIYMWYKDMFRESHYKGFYNFYMQMCFKSGMVVFILSEFMFFFSFFWTYFHFMFMYQGEFSFNWPPLMIEKINYLTLPLFNTMLLLSSGLSLTLAHNNLMLNNLKKFFFYLMLTLVLGLTFTTCQLWEFKMLNYCMSMSSYGSIFFMGTGFHGFHVMLGTFMLILSFIFSLKMILFNNNVFFEMSAWYWHFVDVIWLILFTEFYWWMNFIYEKMILI